MEEAICAIATPYGVGAISIIRTSGFKSIENVNKIFKGKNLLKAESHTISYGHIVDDGNIIDEVMVSIFRAPKSFTTEESVEISCHGGIFSTNKVLEALLKNGFRLALPGEFTKRAFLNKRIDLTQAEAVMDIISSNNNIALKSANNSLRKSTTILIETLREKLLTLIASIEVNIDYPEYDDAITMTNEIVIPNLKQLIAEMNIILEHSQISKIAIHGIKTAIIGRPNVGKSSILNILLDEEKAIVSSIAGTTRDTIEAELSLGGVTLKLIDTAGIRETTDEVEQIGISRSKKAISEAELVLLVLDNSEELTLMDKELLEITKNKKRIIIVNKQDLNKKINLDMDYIKLSVKDKNGLHDLEKKLIEITKINEFNLDDQNYLSNTRHIAKMNEALNSLNIALKACKNNELIDMIEIDIKNAWQALGEIIGDTAPDLLINELFSKFCLGK